MTATIIEHQVEQGTPEWLELRKGAITGSRFCDARDKLKSGAPSKACINYARDVARERCGGSVPPVFQNAAMRTGKEQEPIARSMYEARTGNLVEEVGFFTTNDGLFGLSPDGRIGTDGILEIKTMVSSDTLFTAVAEGDFSAYIDQCNGYMWLLGAKWVDLVLWAPDLNHLVVHRIERDEEEIAALEKDMMAFSKLVAQYERTLRSVLGKADEKMAA